MAISMVWNVGFTSEPKMEKLGGSILPTMSNILGIPSMSITTLSSLSAALFQYIATNTATINSRCHWRNQDRGEGVA
jgi:hypothetical protein